MKVLTIKDVADILKLHPRTVAKMARQGEIPATRIGRVWRFDEDAVLEWFNARLKGETRHTGPGNGKQPRLWNGTTRVADLLSKDAVQYTRERHSKREVLESLATLAARSGRVSDYQLLLDSLVEREQMCPTALEGGIAFPHPRHPLDHMDRPVLAMLVARNGVDFGAPDEAPTRVFVLLLSPDDGTHVRILSHLARLFRNSKTVERLTRCRQANEVVREIKRLEEQLIDKQERQERR
jgi:excisionase family DNA binding protein